MEESNGTTVDLAQLGKYHFHLSHGSVQSTMSLRKRAGDVVKEGVFEAMVHFCRCQMARSSIGLPKVSIHVARFHGNSFGRDVGYIRERSSHDSPLLLCVDSFCNPLRNIRPTAIIEVFESQWRFVFGCLSRLMKAGGHGFVSGSWDSCRPFSM